MPKLDRKTAKVSHEPSDLKRAKTREPYIGGVGPLAWRFSEVDRGGPFGWRFPDDLKFREVLEKLHEFEDKTWDEIMRTQSHPVQLADLSPAARDRLSDGHFEDIDELISFRITGKNRVWCFARAHANIMRVLWWDEDHLVCPTKVDRADRVKDRIKRGR